MDLYDRPGGRIADCQPADLGGRGHVPVHEHRRDRQDFRNVVEPEGPRVGRQQARAVDFQREQIPDGIDVLRAVQAPDGYAPGIGMRRRMRIQRGDKRRSERVGGRPVGLPRGLRRHLPAAQLAHDLLEHRRARAEVVEVDRVEHEPRGLQSLVVAGDAIPIEERSIERRGTRRSLSCRIRRSRGPCGRSGQGARRRGGDPGCGEGNADDPEHLSQR